MHYIRSRCGSNTFDIRISQGKTVSVYCDKYVNGKLTRGSIQCCDVRVTQGNKVNVYCDKFVKI